MDKENSDLYIYFNTHELGEIGGRLLTAAVSGWKFTKMHSVEIIRDNEGSFEGLHLRLERERKKDD